MNMRAFRMKLLTSSIIGTALVLATPAWAQTGPDPATAAPAVTPSATAPATANATSLASDDTIVVTGTLFRRTNTETPSPVSVISAATLEARGLTTVADAVQSIAAANGAGLPQNFTGAFASGAQGISLRGLTTSSTLVVFDGLRAANYPLADDGERSFVDLNTIPDAIVDRVEVLRDGASSNYGADAIAGVVNVILKKEITGVQGRVEGGVSERKDGGGQRVQLTAGYGKLSEQGYNIYLSGEYQHVDEIFLNQRGFPYNTSDLSSINVGGGYTGPNGNTDFLPPSVGGASSSISAVVRPATQTRPSDIRSGVAVPGSTYSILNAGGCAPGTIPHSNVKGQYCEQDLIKRYGVFQPDQTRYGGTAHLTVNVGADAQAYLVGTFYESKVITSGTAQAVRSSNPINTLGLVLPVTLANGSLNAQNPYAAAGQSALLFYRFGDIPVSTTVDSKTYRIAGGIDGKFGNGFGYSFGGTFMETDLDITRHGFINLAGLTDAINTGSYNFATPSANSQAVRDSISPVVLSKANSQLWEIQGTITKELFHLPGGPLQAAVGGQVRYESVNDPNQDIGNATLGINTFEAVGHRYVEAGYFEVDAPVFKQLDVNVSGRYDHYSIGFDHFSPKVGVKFTPIRQIAIRGTYSEGFRAPSIPETSGAVIGFVNYTPPADVIAAHGNNSYVQTYGLGLFSAGNPNLKPETSRSFTLGAVVEPAHWLSFTVDYYNIHKENLIIQSSGGGAQADLYLRGQALPAGYTVTPNPVDPEHPGLPATPFSINALYFNGQSLQTSGLDAQIQAKFKYGRAKLTTTLEGTEIFQYNINDGTGVLQRFVGTLASYNITSASGTPRWRANWQNTLDVEPFSLTATTYFTSGYKGYADDNSGGGSTCADAIAGSYLYTGDVSRSRGGPLHCTTGHFLDVDLTGSIKVAEGSSFYFNIVNLFDVKAPFDPNTYGGNNYNPAWSSAGVLGRYFRIGATFKY